MAKLDPQKSAYIVVGVWNPAIIQPEWLRNEFPEVVPEIIKVEITGPVISVRYDLEDFYLEPLNDRLIFLAKEVNEETLRRISALSDGISDRLQYTPISAAGCNFCFCLDSDERFIRDDLDNGSQTPELFGGLDIVSKSIQHTYSLDDHNINISYAYKGNERELRFNFDYKTPKVAMTEASRMLQSNFKTARELVGKLIIRI